MHLTQKEIKLYQRIQHYYNASAHYPEILMDKEKNLLRKIEYILLNKKVEDGHHSKYLNKKSYDLINS